MKEEEIEKEETTEKLRKELEGAAENEYKQTQGTIIEDEEEAAKFKPEYWNEL